MEDIFIKQTYLAWALSLSGTFCSCLEAPMATAADVMPTEGDGILPCTALKQKISNKHTHTHAYILYYICVVYVCLYT